MKLSPIYEVPLGAFIMIDGKPVNLSGSVKAFVSGSESFICVNK